MNREAQIRLLDGRMLAYAEYGDPYGKPVFFCQGTPSSRLMRPSEDQTRQLGARLIVADRPGFGLSDPKPGRSLLDWADDVACLADQLKIGAFPVIGISGGGPYAAACAHRMPDRVTSLGLVSAAGPTHIEGSIEGGAGERKAGFIVARRAPWLLTLVIWLFRNPGRNPERFLDRFSPGFPEIDRRIQSQPEIRAMFLNSYREASRQGVRAFADEVSLVSRPWGFRLEEIRVPTYLWHGGLDKSTPLGMGKHMAETIPGCRAYFMPNEGHLLIFEHWTVILTTLLNHVPERGQNDAAHRKGDTSW